MKDIAERETVPAPLYRDPIYDGAADPTIIWNRQEKTWWIVYTQRHANVACRGVAWGHGTDIGIASSADNGMNWVYRGILQGLAYERGRNSYWAPEIIWHEGLYHMYVSYVPGVPHDWSGSRHILHYTSRNLWDWECQSRLTLSSDNVIDACVFRLMTGVWRMWYKDEVNGSHTYAADSDDLANWTVVGPAITDCAHEGPNVFFWKDRYWMITDPWNGLGVYRSDDAETWARQENILTTGCKRVDDGTRGDHADVLVSGENAYIFYFTHPGRIHGEDVESVNEVYPYEWKRTSLQVAQLKHVDGRLLCDRNEPFGLELREPGEQGRE